MPLDKTRTEALKTKSRLSLKEISEKMGVSDNTVGRWLRGDVQPTSLNLSMLAEVLKTSSDYLLGLTDDPTPPTKNITPESLSAKERKLIEAWRSGRWRDAMQLLVGDDDDG